MGTQLVFVNRLQEVHRLRDLVAARRPALVVLRGRRRVGKSALLHEAIPHGRVVSYQADEQDVEAQLRLLAREAAALLPGSPPLAFSDWDWALEFFGRAAADDPLVVILDEFQFLCSAETALPSIVQRHWDRWDRDGVPLVLVLAGSALSFMDGLLDHGAPLFGRATYRPLLLPLDYRDATELGPGRATPSEQVVRYAVLGGTPQYQLWAGRRRTANVIRDAILTKGAPLYEEPLQLLRAEDELREPRGYFSVLRALGAGRTRTGEIASAVGRDTSATSRLLERLAELGYAELREPLQPSGPRARGIWQIADPYFRFWFRYVFPNRSRLERGRVAEVYREIDADLDTYTGVVFEEVCRAWLARYSEAGQDADAVGSWWSRRADAEIDVVAMRSRDYRFLGACKWSTRVGADVLERLHAHRALLGSRAAQAELAVFGRGFTERARERAAREHVRLVGIDELF
ncbi:MAG: ATP-binding protein [Actinobacteria bacterium]|nr:ATP-binding protein [Actinomycetota bacterium]